MRRLVATQNDVGLNPTLDSMDFFNSFKKFEHKIEHIKDVFACYDFIFEKMTDFIDLETEKCIVDF